MSVINYLAETNALAVLPFSVVFAQRKESRVVVLPYDIPQPNRSLGLLRHTRSGRSAATERVSIHIVSGFEELKHVIKRHENAIVWGC